MPELDEHGLCRECGEQRKCGKEGCTHTAVLVTHFYTDAGNVTCVDSCIEHMPNTIRIMQKLYEHHQARKN